MVSPFEIVGFRRIGLMQDGATFDITFERDITLEFTDLGNEAFLYFAWLKYHVARSLPWVIKVVPIF